MTVSALARPVLIVAAALTLQGCKAEPTASNLETVAGGFEDFVVDKRADPIFDRTIYTIKANFVQFNDDCTPAENDSYLCEACNFTATYDLVPHRNGMFRTFNSGVVDIRYVLSPSDSSEAGWRAQEETRLNFTPSPEKIGAGTALYDDVLKAVSANRTSEAKAAFKTFMRAQCAASN
ncbi:MAG: hypothetical protein AAF382_07335 [Pseudomonadota bacterium]